MLGWELERAFQKRGVVALNRLGLDIADPGKVAAALAQYKPAAVVNAAAYTSVDGAETEKKAAQRANGLGPSTLGNACREFGVKLVHFSTDQVFDGTGDKPKKETDPPNPINYYGLTKLEGETGALLAPGALVLRVQWLYGEKKIVSRR